MAESVKRYAVVTGGNRGIGFSICKLLASNGVTVVLTARDHKRGLEAVEKLNELGLKGHVVFHYLDVTDRATIPPLFNFIVAQFGKLDILVNNAGISAVVSDVAALAASDIEEKGPHGFDWSKILNLDEKLVEPAIKTNYYGPKHVSEALVPLLQLSDSPRIVNVSATMGGLEFIQDAWTKEVLSDIENLTPKKIKVVVDQFLLEYQKGLLETKGWSSQLSVYTISKAALNAYTRLFAKKYPSFCVNAVCPGHVKSDFSHNTGNFTTDEGAECVVRLALLPNGSSSGLFFNRNEVRPF
ncbi:hypothetical protein Lal_00024587 [Lupinus albus]|uniref:Putative oxidoreductase n=1 Tax=Lupinus albus TaxID=3870 RepID=A0A6A5NN40_LUPAL|nr:putative oxidoreductase [Lupinus albus]KAF1889264.1 hypothetical protein Lal_00024587 [Lupinus albus]